MGIFAALAGPAAAAAGAGGGAAGLGSILGSAFGATALNSGKALLTGGLIGGLGSRLGAGRRKRMIKGAKKDIEAFRQRATQEAEGSKDEVRRTLTEAQGQVDASLIDRGLYNSTVRDAQRQQANQAAASQMAGIDNARFSRVDDYATQVLGSIPQSGGLGQYLGQIAQNVTTMPPDPTRTAAAGGSAGTAPSYAGMEPERVDGGLGGYMTAALKQRKRLAVHDQGAAA